MSSLPARWQEAIELRAAVDVRRRELGLTLWQVAVQMDINLMRLTDMRNGVASTHTRELVTAWLHRHSPPPSAPIPQHQEGAQHHGGGPDPAHT